jgi:co-chaperonin GroES (HSP10)
MQPRLIKTLIGQYEPVKFEGKNKSGWTAIGDRVLVLPDQVPTQTAGGIELPEETRERHTFAAETGVLVAIGPDAFLWNSDRTRKWEGEKPQIGDRVYFERYSGGLVRGDDDLFYRCCDDKQIGLVKQA